MTPRRMALGPVGLLVVAAVVVLSPLAAASGTGYNLTYIRAAGSTSNANIDLVSVTTSDTGGATISVTLQVSGHFVLDSGDYVYWAWFGGSASSNATGYATFSNNTTAGQWFSSSGGGFGFGSLAYTLGGGGSTLNFQMNKTAVGPESGFSVNAEAVYSFGTGSGGISWLGTDYQGALNCGPTGCTGPVANALTSAFWTWVIIAVASVAVVVVVVVVLVVVTRRRRVPPVAPGMPPAGAPPPPPPPPPGSAPPPPGST